MCSTAATWFWTCLHNFFLRKRRTHGQAAGLRKHEYQPGRRSRLCGYLLCRGGVHQLAYAVALSKMTGVDVPKMLPIPDIRTDKIPECREFIAQGMHRSLYRFSADDYKHIEATYSTAPIPEDGQPLEVREGTIPGHPLADLPPAPASGIPSVRHGRAERNYRPLDEEYVSESPKRGRARNASGPFLMCVFLRRAADFG